MSTRLRLLPVFAALLLAACGSTDESAGTEKVLVQNDVPEQTMFVGSMTDLLKAGKATTCTFTRTDENAVMRGTVYVAPNGRVAGDFTIEGTPVGTVTMHMIRNGDYAYTWGMPSPTQGMKVKLDAAGKPANPSADAKNDVVDESMNYSCSEWTVNEAKFSVPADVTFTDVSETAKAMQNGNCGACDMIPDAAQKAECKKALGC